MTDTNTNTTNRWTYDIQQEYASGRAVMSQIVCDDAPETFFAQLQTAGEGAWFRMDGSGPHRNSCLIIPLDTVVSIVVNKFKPGDELVLDKHKLL